MKQNTLLRVVCRGGPDIMFGLSKNQSMKKINLLLPVVACICLLSVFTACSKSGVDGGLSKGQCEITATYSGAASGDFKSSLTLSTSVKVDPLIVLTTASVKLPPQTCQLSIPAIITKGVHTQSGGTVNGITILFSDGTNGYAIGGDGATGFSVTIDEINDGEIRGSFSGQLGNDSKKTKITISNGRFSAKY